MNQSVWSKRLLKYVGFPLIAVLVLYILWDGSNGWGSGEVFTGIGLLLVAGAMMYLKRLENVSEKNIAQRIRADFPAEFQPQVFKTYEHLKTKELEGLFLKILDDAHGDPNQVKNFASIAESVGWRAFLENRW